jgi:putative membrane protein
MVGIIGIIYPPTNGLFLALTPVMLFYNAVLLFSEETAWFVQRWWALLLIAVLGMLAEYAGVNYGLIFGEYSYGSILGPKIGGVPFIIGINWMMLILAARSGVQKVSSNFIFTALISALFVLGIDFLLEPVAIKYGWWQWDGVEIPMSNYIAWFVLAFIFQLLLGGKKIKSGRSFWILMVQCLFFIVLQLWA